MLYLCEFELTQDDDMVVATPFGLGGATQGHDLRDAAEMAADWLRLNGEVKLMKGEPLPQLPLGNQPTDGGRILLVAVDITLDGIDVVRAGEAARILGVTRGRVTQMINSGRLMGFRDGRDTYVTRESLEARLKSNPGPGRPSTEATQATSKAAVDNLGRKAEEKPHRALA